MTLISVGHCSITTNHNKQLMKHSLLSLQSGIKNNVICVSDMVLLGFLAVFVHVVQICKKIHKNMFPSLHSGITGRTLKELVKDNTTIDQKFNYLSKGIQQYMKHGSFNSLLNDIGHTLKEEMEHSYDDTFEQILRMSMSKSSAFLHQYIPMKWYMDLSFYSGIKHISSELVTRARC